MHARCVARRTRELGPGIARRLRQAREAAGLTVRELAQRAHVNPGTVQRISDGLGGNAGVGTLTDLARALRVRPEWLVFGSGERDI
jgi:transcriptional regulator with XRE-family HTH domain